MTTMGGIVVDVQGDFTTWKKGALAVAGTDAAFIEKLRKATETLKQSGCAVFATQDWHPADHISFYTNHPGRKPFDVVDVRNKKQVLWPPHCVQGSENAKLLLAEAFFDAIVKKGTDRRYDSYSGFQDDGGARTEMDGLLKKKGIQELIIYGIATDYCVKATALDAANAGFKVTVVSGLCRGVAPDTTAAALEEMQANGITLREEL
jgi:nicotinamidase/pyrazinamidase